MQPSEFIKKCCSRYLWGNILAMVVFVFVMALVVKVGLNIYTHHGESVAIPDVRHKSMTDARHILEEAGLVVEVSDTGYIKELPADCVLEQSPAPGARVKEGHSINIIVNASSTPTLSLPDVAGNSSFREAQAKLKAMGFKMGMPQYVEGEKDWVYGVTVDGVQKVSGDRIPVNKMVVLQVGNGLMSADDSVHYVDYHMDSSESYIDIDEEDIDLFEEIP